MGNPVEMEFEGQGSRVYVRETAPGSLIVFWYPNSQADQESPGRIMDAAEMSDFPAKDALAGNRQFVLAWINRQDWAQPFSHD